MIDTLAPTDIHIDSDVGNDIAAELQTPALRSSNRTISWLDVLVGAHAVALAVLVGGANVGEVVRSAAVIAIAILMLVRLRRRGTPGIDAQLLVFGLGGLMAGLVIGTHHTVVSAGSPVSLAGTVLVGSGLVLVVIGVRRLVRRLRRWRKLVALPIGLVALVAFVMPLMLSMFVTNVPDYALGEATPADFGLDYRDVTVTTSDGVDLAAWYIPSSNGAALVQLGGCCAARDDELEYTAVLARHGYGVLMLDQRGHGGSEGDGMLWGWWGELDVAAGVDFLATQPDVLDGRIAAIGMSVGGEQVIAAAGVDHRIKAVVAEGVSARGARDEGDPASGASALFIRYVDWVTKQAASMMTSADTPTQLRHAVDTMASDQRLFLIISSSASNEVNAAEMLTSVGPGIVSSWTIDSEHIQGLATHPVEWERRVISFLDNSLSA